ncbi:MAG: hypothetical protein ACJ75J_05450 [Cytophagaceae bacterium]
MKQLANILILILSMATSQIFAQSKALVKIRGEAQTEWNQRLETLAQAEKRVSDLAVINALEQAFGKLVIQGNTTFLRNVNTGTMVETQSVFNTIANTYVKGEVIEVLDKKIRRINYVTQVNGQKEDRIDLKCEIYVSAREISTPPVSFSALTLSQPKKNFETRDFYNGDDFYLFFRSPESGYLTIYLDDNSSSYRILPYTSAPSCQEQGMPVTADQEYMFFSGKRASSDCGGQSYEIDHYQMFTRSDIENNSVYLLFSKEPLTKPMLAPASGEGLSDELAGKGYKLPRSLGSSDFYTWLAGVRSSGQVQMQRIDLSIIKKQ